jgi:hypothetical protein
MLQDNFNCTEAKLIFIHGLNNTERKAKDVGKISKTSNINLHTLSDIVKENRLSRHLRHMGGAGGLLYN